MPEQSNKEKVIAAIRGLKERRPDVAIYDSDVTNTAIADLTVAEVVWALDDLLVKGELQFNFKDGWTIAVDQGVQSGGIVSA